MTKFQPESNGKKYQIDGTVRADLPETAKNSSWPVTDLAPYEGFETNPRQSWE